MSHSTTPHSDEGNASFGNKCSDPSLRWESPPTENASDEEILEFLDHAENCAYHAEMLQMMDSAILQTIKRAYPNEEEGRSDMKATFSEPRYFFLQQPQDDVEDYLFSQADLVSSEEVNHPEIDVPLQFFRDNNPANGQWSNISLYCSEHRMLFYTV